MLASREPRLTDYEKSLIFLMDGKAQPFSRTRFSLALLSPTKISGGSLSARLGTTHKIKMHVHSTLRFPWLNNQYAKTDKDKRLHKALLHITRLLLTQASPDGKMETSFALLLLLGVGKAGNRLA